MRVCEISSLVGWWVDFGVRHDFRGVNGMLLLIWIKFHVSIEYSGQSHKLKMRRTHVRLLKTTQDPYWFGSIMKCGCSFNEPEGSKSLSDRWKITISTQCVRRRQHRRLEMSTKPPRTIEIIPNDLIGEAKIVAITCSKAAAESISSR